MMSFARCRTAPGWTKEKIEAEMRRGLVDARGDVWGAAGWVVAEAAHQLP